MPSKTKDTNEPDIIVRQEESQALAPQSLTPAQMLSLAVQQEASVEKLDKLMALQERWERNEARKAFEQAMVHFSAQVPTILKTRIVDFSTQKGRTHYKFAGLPETVEQIQVLMAQCQLSRRWADEEPQKTGNIRIRCYVTHVSGHSESFAAEAAPDTSGNKNEAQAVASIITYLRRTTLFSVLGLVAKDEIDDDGAGGKPASEPKAATQEELESAPNETHQRAEFRRVAEAKVGTKMSNTALRTLLWSAQETTGSSSIATCTKYINQEDVFFAIDGTIKRPQSSSSPMQVGEPTEGQADLTPPGTDAQPTTQTTAGPNTLHHVASNTDAVDPAPHSAPPLFQQDDVDPKAFDTPPTVEEPLVVCSKGHTMKKADVLPSTLVNSRKGELGMCPKCQKEIGMKVIVREQK